jgi:hypothetical protein
MARWILLVLCLCSGCAGYRTRVTFTTVNGKPAVSFEVEESRRLNYADR